MAKAVLRHDLESHDMSRLHAEHHLINRVGWLRAAVLGANDGIISTASLMVGVATAASSSSEVLLTGIAGLVAGSMSMAAGEYVSVSSQADTERADLGRERQELATDRDAELQELATIYVGRGVEPTLARQVAEQLMAKDALAAHAHDELGISEAISANPIQAALTSAATFAAGAALPILAALVAPRAALVLVRVRRIADCPGASRRNRRQGRRSRDAEAHGSGRILGSVRDGHHGRHWRCDRKSRLRPTKLSNDLLGHDTQSRDLSGVVPWRRPPDKDRRGARHAHARAGRSTLG